MAAMDLQAERDKVQREIDALEKSLGLNVEALNVEVSDSSDDSDDYLDQVQLDGDGQTEDVIWEDGGSSAEMCLQMNLVYQAVIEEKLQELEVLITQNKEQQDELMWELAGRKTQRAGTSKLYPLNLAIGHFMKPYFKDKVSGVGPPGNSEMRERSGHIVKSFQELSSKKWRPSDTEQLKKAVFSDKLQKLLQPKLLKVEYLQQKLDSSKSEIDKKILRKQIHEAENEIDDINQLQEDILLGQRTDDHDWEKIANINFEGVHTAERLCSIWKNSEHPHLNKEKWSTEEIQRLKEIAKAHNFVNWEAIAQELGTRRTGFQCLQMFQHNNKGFKRCEFTKEEDEILTHFVQRMRVGEHIPYYKISYFMEGRDGLQLMHRWTKRLDPRLKKGLWSKEEDEMLLKAVAKHGAKDWYKIREEVPGRSDVQCRERYLKGLNKDIKKGKWSEEENDKLVELTKKHGIGHWAKVSKEMPHHRTASQCHSRWKHLSGFYKQKNQMRKMQRPPQPPRPPKPQQAVKITKAMSSKEDTSSGSSSSEESLVMSSSSESEDEPMELMDYSNETEISYLLPSVPNLDLWIPKKKNSAVKSSSLFVYSESSFKSNSKSKQKKSNEDTFQLYTILKGIAYSASTDIVTETIEDFLKEAEENGQEILQIQEEDIAKILMKNTQQSHMKQIQRLRQRQCKALSETGQQTDSAVSFSQSTRKRLYRTSVDRKLLCAVTRWVGNVLLPLPTIRGKQLKKTIRADEMNKKLSCVTVTSTPIFTFLIQLFQIDAGGCLQMIQQRRFDEYEFFKRIKNTARRTLNSVPMSPKSILAQSSNDQEPIPVMPQVTTEIPKPRPRKRRTPKPPKIPKVRSMVPVPKPKTVYELLQEKRIQKANAAKASRERAVLTGNFIIPPQLLIQQSPNVTVPPQTMVHPVTPATSQNGSRPDNPLSAMPACQAVTTNNVSASPTSSDRGGSIGKLVADPTGSAPVYNISAAEEKAQRSNVPASPLVLPHQATLLPNITLPAPNQSALPIALLVTPQGLISVTTQALPCPKLTKHSESQGPKIVSTPLNTAANSALPKITSSLSQENMATTSSVARNLLVTSPCLPMPAPSGALKVQSETVPAISSSLSQEDTKIIALVKSQPQLTGSSQTLSQSTESKVASDILPPLTSAITQVDTAAVAHFKKEASSHLPTLNPTNPSKNPSQTLPVFGNSLILEGPLQASSVASQPQTDGNCLPKVTLAPELPNKESQLKLTPQKYPVVQMTRIMQTGIPKEDTLNVRNDPQCSTGSNNCNPFSNSQRKTLDVKIISLEEETVKDWLQVKQCMEMPNQKSAIPFLPPSICTLKTFSRLLLEKKTLEENAFKLLPSVDGTNGSSPQMQATLSHMVEEKLKDNLAYQLLKQRFISAFTVPGFLAVLPPAPVHIKQEDSDEDIEDVMSCETNLVKATHNENDTAAEGEAVCNASGAAVPMLVDQETAIHCSAENPNNTDYAESITTRRSVYCRPAT